MTALALATLGDVTEIGSFLFFVALPKVAKAGTVICCCCWCYHAKLRQWKHNFRRDCILLNKTEQCIRLCTNSLTKEHLTEGDEGSIHLTSSIRLLLFLKKVNNDYQKWLI
jgi:hypothetical protein